MAESLFGPTPDAVRRQMAQERLFTAQAIGQMGPGGHGALAGGLLGQGIGSLFQGEDPRLRRANALQEINQELTAQGLAVGEPGFREALVPMVRSRLGLEAALQANQMAFQAEQQESQIAALRRGPVATQRNLMRAGFSETEALDLAQDPELARDILKSRFKPAELTTLQRNAMAAYPGDPAQAQQTIRDVMKARAAGQSVTVNNFQSKELGKDAADWVNAQGERPPPSLSAAQASELGFRPQTKEESTAAVQQAKSRQAQAIEAQEVDNALGELKGTLRAVQARGLGSTLTSPVESFTELQLLDADMNRVAKALAQLRNPGEAEASDAATQAIKASMPSIRQILANPSTLDAFIEKFQREANQARPPGRVTAAPAELSDADLEAEIRALEQKLGQ